MKNKQTALIYFLNGLLGLEKEYNIKLETINRLHKLYFEAKEIEKQQIIDAYNNGNSEWSNTEFDHGWDYFDQTYEQ